MGIDREIIGRYKGNYRGIKGWLCAESVLEFGSEFPVCERGCVDSAEMILINFTAQRRGSYPFFLRPS